MAQREQYDTCAEHDAARPGGEDGQRHAEVENRILEGQVLAGPERSVAEPLGELGDRCEDPGVGPPADELARALDAETDAAVQAGRTIHTGRVADRHASFVKTPGPLTRRSRSATAMDAKENS